MTDTPNPKRQSMARAAIFKSQEGKPSAFHGVIDVLQDIPKGTALDITLYKEVSKNGNGYLSGPCYIQPVRAAKNPDDLDVDF
jgi:hypothetical protein